MKPEEMIPLAVPNLAGREGTYLQQCITTTFVSTVGEFVGRFESLVAEASGAPFCVATSAGTTALHAGLVALGVRPGDLVICPSLTFIASANAISHAGATPWLMDVNRESWTLDPDVMADSLERNTRRTPDGLIHLASGRRVSAVVAVFTLGCPVDMDPVMEIARSYGLKVLVDGAAGLGANYKGRAPAETGADLVMFSFNGNKTVTAGGGGALVGHDETLMKLVRHLTTTARTSPDYDHDMVGFNYRMTNLQAAVGCAQMENLGMFVAAKRRIAARYDAALADGNSVHRFPDPDWADSACWFSGIYVPLLTAEQHASIRARLRENKIDARPFWKPMHLQKPYADAPRSSMDVTDAIWPHVLTLPCSTALTEDEQEYVIECVKKELARAGL